MFMVIFGSIWVVNMDKDWAIDEEMETDLESDMDDDENEIRQLDAALEEAEIEVCDTNSFGQQGWTAIQPATSRTTTVDPYTASSQPNAGLSEDLSKIDSALSLNKLCDEKMRRLERILGLRLRECRLKLSEIQSSSTMPDKQESFRYINCGRPYFRDENNYPAPDNDDAIIAKNQMYDFSLITSVPGWTVRDKNQFSEVMTKVSLNVRKEEYNDKIFEVKNLKNMSEVKKAKQIAKLKKARDSLNSKIPFAQLALPLDKEYDWDILANTKLNRRHTPHEYKCLWKLYFHPSINKTSWKNSEHSMLQMIAAQYKYQDWDAIAKKLDTGRTGYQCFVYYRTNMNNTAIGKKWTPEEITYLKRLIDYFSEDFYIPWGKIAAAMENRTKIQIYNKYLRLIEQRKGRFLPEEDAVILNCVQRFGTNFRRMTEYLAHRSMVQIRARYQVLSKMRVSTVWSVEDDRKLIQIITNQDPGMTFSTATKFFPGRNRVNIRSRYMTLIKWMKKHPNLDIEHAPRRGARRLNHGQATDDLNQAIENLKNTLNTEVEIKKNRKKITRNSSEFDIEDAIVATLVNEAVKEQEQMKSLNEGSIVLSNDAIVSCKDLNTTNLRKCLIFLSSALDKKAFQESHFVQDYSDLVDNNVDVNLFRLRSYSKKSIIKTVQCPGNPNIWGSSTLGPRSYVLPPHYATITGCKGIMSHITAMSMYCDSINLHVIIRRNKLLKEHMDRLLERFYTLFLWPLLLSNEGPPALQRYNLCKTDSFYIRPPNLPEAPAVTIKYDTYKKFQIKDVSEQIDLNEDVVPNQKITVETSLNKDSDV